MVQEHRKQTDMVAEMLRKSKFLLCFMFMLYEVLFVIYFIFMLHVLLYIYYIFIRILYVFLNLLYIFIFTLFILNLCDKAFIFIICTKLL